MAAINGYISMGITVQKVSFVFSVVVTSKFLKRSVYKSASVDRVSVETVTAVGKR